MKKILFTLMLGGIFPVQAAFIQDTPKVVNIAEVKEMADDTPVLVQGSIIQQLEEDKYLFKDETDEIVVEIGKKAWNKVDVRASDIVQLDGSIDKDFSDDIEIEVKKVIPVQVEKPQE